MSTRAAVYTRVSNKDQVEGYSLEAQRDALYAYANREGLEVVKLYEEQGRSASNEDTSKRIEFSHLMADARAGLFDVVLVHKYDRFSRKVVVLLRSLDELLSLKIRFYSLTEGESQITTAQGFLQTGMFGLLAEFYQRNLAAEIQKGKRTKAERYGVQNGTVPFGYQAGDSPKSPPAPEPAEAAIVKEMFTRYATGEWSISELAAWAHQAGARPHSRTGSLVFTDFNCKKVLRNRFYLGYIQYRGEELPGSHEPLIDEELWNKVQAVKFARQRTKRSTARTKHHWLLGYVARCSGCGHKLKPQSGEAGRVKPTPYYSCKAYERRVACPSKQHGCTMQKADAFMHQLMASFGSIPRVMEAVTAASTTYRAENQLGTARERRLLEQRLARAEAIYLDGEMPKERYIAEKRKIEAQLSQLVEPTAAVSNQAVAELMGMAEAWEWADDEERARVVRTIFRDVVVDTDLKRIVAVRPYLPFVQAVQPAAAALGISVETGPALGVRAVS